MKLIKEAKQLNALRHILDIAKRSEDKNLIHALGFSSREELNTYYKNLVEFIKDFPQTAKEITGGIPKIPTALQARYLRILNRVAVLTNQKKKWIFLKRFYPKASIA